MRKLNCIAIALLLVTAACGKKDEDKSGKANKGKKPDKTKAGKTTGPATDKPKQKKLPPPPKANFKGKARLINLYLTDAGKTITADVWARRTFTHGPVQLAKDVKFGAASDWFGVPKGHSIAVVKAGDGPDGKELGGIYSPKEGEHVTATLMTGRKNKGSVTSDWETGKSQAPEPPAKGKGQIILHAYQLRANPAHAKALQAAKLGDAFYVGDGKGNCLPQRKNLTSILGGTQPTRHEVAPGKVTVALYKWPSNEKCSGKPLFKLDVDVAADKTKLVKIYTPDGKSLAGLVLDSAVGTGPAPAKK